MPLRAFGHLAEGRAVICFLENRGFAAFVLLCNALQQTGANLERVLIYSRVRSVTGSNMTSQSPWQRQMGFMIASWGARAEAEIIQSFGRIKRTFLSLNFPLYSFSKHKYLKIYVLRLHILLCRSVCVSLHNSKALVCFSMCSSVCFSPRAPNTSERLCRVR